jgi:hypothetical protein
MSRLSRERTGDLYMMILTTFSARTNQKHIGCAFSTPYIVSYVVTAIFRRPKSFTQFYQLESYAEQLPFARQRGAPVGLAVYLGRERVISTRDQFDLKSTFTFFSMLNRGFGTDISKRHKRIALALGTERWRFSSVGFFSKRMC